MGIRAFFHKIKMGFLRSREASIPFVDAVKRYGNTGEDTLVVGLRRELPACRIKKNVMIFTPEGNAEIDCLVLYGDKLFAIEVKRWRGQLTETEDGFRQEKTDRWTGEIHTKQVRSPFKQLGRAIYLLKKQIPIKAWVNPIIFLRTARRSPFPLLRSMYGLTACLLSRIISSGRGKHRSAPVPATFSIAVSLLTLFTQTSGEIPCIVSSIAQL